MKLLTAELIAKFPKLYETEKVPNREKKVVAKFFFPAGRFTFYAVEFDGTDTFFGYTKSPLGEDCDEWGYASLSELQSLKVRGLGVERDLHWNSETTFAEVEDGKKS